MVYSERFGCGGAPKSKVLLLGCCGGRWSGQGKEDGGKSKSGDPTLIWVRRFLVPG